MTFEEMASHASLLIIAGSETTATLLSGATYELATHPEVLAKLAAEVRAAFPSEDDISIAGTSSLPYLLAVLDESLRIYPPVPGASPRKIAKGGDTIVDQFVPEDVSTKSRLGLINGGPLVPFLSPPPLSLDYGVLTGVVPTI